MIFKSAAAGPALSFKGFHAFADRMRELGLVRSRMLGLRSCGLCSDAKAFSGRAEWLQLGVRCSAVLQNLFFHCRYSLASHPFRRDSRPLRASVQGISSTA